LPHFGCRSLALGHRRVNAGIGLEAFKITTPIL